MDMPPFTIEPRSEIAVVQQRLEERVPLGAPADDVERTFRASGFSCQHASGKLVCKRQFKLNIVQQEVWTIAFDVDRTAMVTGRRVRKGYIAP